MQGKPPFQLQYLGGYAPGIENTLCILVSFFHPLFQPNATNHTPFLFDFLASFSACVVIPFLESSRSKRSFLLGLPVVMGSIYQLFSGALIFPVYWAVFLAVTRDDAVGSEIAQADAEAVLFGFVMGYLLPSFAMGYVATPGPIAVWQIFPVLISLFTRLHLIGRPRRLHSGSGYRTVQATYIICFIISALVHLRTLAYYKFDFQTITTSLLPSLEIPDPKKGHTRLMAINLFLQWDAVFIFGSTFMASLWFVGSVVQATMLISWIAVTSAMLGPGAAISGIYLWREASLNKARLHARKLAKSQ